MVRWRKPLDLYLHAASELAYAAAQLLLKYPE